MLRDSAGHSHHVTLSEWKFLSPSKNGVLARSACDWPYASSYCHSFFSLLILGPGVGGEVMPLTNRGGDDVAGVEKRKMEKVRVSKGWCRSSFFTLLPLSLPVGFTPTHFLSLALPSCISRRPLRMALRPSPLNADSRNKCPSPLSAALPM